MENILDINVCQNDIETNHAATCTKVEEQLHYVFKDKNLLIQALTHKSYANEHKYEHQSEYSNQHKIDNKYNNERLEFLGDAILDAITIEYIYKKYPDADEGQLAKMKSKAVSEPALAEVSKKLTLGQCLYIGHGEEQTKGRERASILCDVLEAVIGAIYLDSTYDITRDVVLQIMRETIDNIDTNEKTADYKSILQEYTQHKYKVLPSYCVTKENGPTNDKTFEVAVGIVTSGVPAKSQLKFAIFRAKHMAKGEGKTKKSAEQMAAKKLCEALGVQGA